MRLVYSREAAIDLWEIEAYISEYSPVRASSFVEEIRLRCRLLLSMPEGFPLVPRYEASGIRRRVYANYSIFYRVRDERVQIVRVLHASRDYVSALGLSAD